MTDPQITWAEPDDPFNRRRHALGGHIAWGRIYPAPTRTVEVHRWWVQFSFGHRYLWIGR